jgi:hypothetical protein
MEYRHFAVSSLYLSSSVVLLSAWLTNYKSDKIYRGSGVEQLQPVAAILTGVPILPCYSMPLTIEKIGQRLIAAINELNTLVLQLE